MFSIAVLDVTFVNLRFVNHITVFDRLIKKKRVTKYAAEQKVRRCRVALQELGIYFEKENRSSFEVNNAASEAAIKLCLADLKKRGPTALWASGILLMSLLARRARKLDFILNIFLHTMSQTFPAMTAMKSGLRKIAVLASEAATNAVVQAALHTFGASASDTVATVGILDSAQSFQHAA